jgi:hypothetical protein
VGSRTYCCSPFSWSPDESRIVYEAIADLGIYVYLVAAPRLLDANCRTVEQMRLINALCRLVEYSEAPAKNS